MGTRKNAVLAWCGIAAPLFFVLMVVVASTRYPGYSHMTQAISELGGVDSPLPFIQNLNFFVTGILIVAFTVGLHAGIAGGSRPVLGPALVAVFGIVMVPRFLLPCDSGCEFVSIAGSLHNITGLAAFLAAVAGIFFTSRRLVRDQRWNAYRAYSVITAIAGLVILVLWIGIAKVARIQSVNGLLQRLYAGTVFLWIEVMAIRLFTLSRRSPHERGSSIAWR